MIAVPAVKRSRSWRKAAWRNEHMVSPQARSWRIYSFGNDDFHFDLLLHYHWPADGLYRPRAQLLRNSGFRAQSFRSDANLGLFGVGPPPGTSIDCSHKRYLHL